MRHQESTANSHEQRPRMSVCSLFGAVALAALAVAVVVSIPDIKRYIRIVTM